MSVRLSSQFDAFCRARTEPLSLNKFANSEVELRRVGGVNAPVGSRRKLVANSVHTADALRLNSTVESHRRQRCVLCIRT